MVRANGTPLVMLLDTGARVSSLTRATADAHPELIAGAETRSTTVGGAGGMVTHDDALSIPALTMHVGATPVALTNVRVLNRTSIGDGGLIGQDVMRSGGSYVIDFDAMRFEVTPRA
ncbi:MAG: hypothetical protein HC850_18010 [Rhodomicrobium sp.]|nr:hypothetical protein [Rhodomicrobium sp.]